MKSCIINSRNIPLKENKFNSPEKYTVLFILSIKLEKLIVVPKIDFPTAKIDDETREIKSTNCIHIHKEEFIIAINNMDLKINCLGLSTFEYVRCDTRKEIE